MKLDRVRGFVFDVDGTLAMSDGRLSGYQPLPGARELLAALRARRVPYVAETSEIRMQERYSLKLVRKRNLTN